MASVEHISVSSSNLKSVGYDEDEEVLELTFHSGGTYQYSDVPSYIYQGLMNASSKGSYFHSNIKNRYSTTKVR